MEELGEGSLCNPIAEVRSSFCSWLSHVPQHGSSQMCLHPTADDNATIRVTNLSEDTREADLQELFRPFGAISRIYLAKDKNTGQSKVGAGLNAGLWQSSPCLSKNILLLFLVGICFHQFPSSGGRIQSHHRSVRIWIRSPHSQCWMGQVRLVSHCWPDAIDSCSPLLFLPLYRPSNNWIH